MTKKEKYDRIKKINVKQNIRTERRGCNNEEKDIAYIGMSHSFGSIVDVVHRR